MTAIGNGESPAFRAVAAADAPSHEVPLPAAATSLNPPELTEDDVDDTDDADDNATETNQIGDEDVESLIGLSMNHVATRLKLSNTPSVEKRNALEDGSQYIDSAFDLPSQEDTIDGGQEAPSTSTVSIRGVGASFYTEKSTARLSMPPNGISQIGKPSEPAQSSISGVFSGLDRKRSLSGSADALRKLLPKNLPSMSQVGNLFGTSSAVQRSKFEGDLSMSTVTSHAKTDSTQTPRLESLIAAMPTDAASPKILRQSTSDNNLLYHTLSRASSLGDDSRFENQHDQVNSRVKAIRDSFTDRTSFRLPQMPSMPSMPNFSFNMGFLPSSVPTRSTSDADVLSDILPKTVTNKRASTFPNPTALPNISSVVNPKPEPPAEYVRHVHEGPHAHPLDRALESLTGDVVVMGGYRGSILRSTKTNRQVWVPVKVGLNIRKVDLEVGLEPEDEERMHKSIYASGMLQNIGPVDISKRLFKRLSECENARNGKLRVWDYGYDWRLSPHLLSKRLTTFLEGLPSNQPGAGSNRGALLISHSLGGVITRHVVNQRPELFSGVVYAGVPQSCINILGPIRNGDAVLLSSRVLTAQVNFTLRTSFVLLPEDSSCFVDINTKEKYPVDFFNPDDWVKYRLSPCTDPPLPPRLAGSTSIGSLLNRSNTLLNLSLPGRKSISSVISPYISTSSLSTDEENKEPQQPLRTARAANVLRDGDVAADRSLAPLIGRNSNPVNKGLSTNSSVSTAVTLPRDKAIAYLRRTLTEVKKFKGELHFRPELEELNQYPPLSVIYGKSTPTCCGAKVNGREGIPCSDSYDNLAFASGDGVVLAKEAMLPSGYKLAYGGRIRSDRGHVTLLGDLNAVGKAIEAVCKVRAKGVGLGLGLKDETSG